VLSAIAVNGELDRYHEKLAGKSRRSLDSRKPDWKVTIPQHFRLCRALLYAINLLGHEALRINGSFENKHPLSQI
jgi:hypothetical protein